MANDPPDVRLELSQLELPDDFDAADLEALTAAVARAAVRTEVVVRPDGAPRDPLIAAATMFVISFLTAHGMEVALNMGERALWEGIQAAFRRLRGGPGAAAQPARIGVRFPDGTLVFVEAQSADQLLGLVRALQPG